MHQTEPWTENQTQRQIEPQIESPSTRRNHRLSPFLSEHHNKPRTEQTQNIILYNIYTMLDQRRRRWADAV